MERLNTIAETRDFANASRERQARIGFVPTMGYLHEGHLSLVDIARGRVGDAGSVIVSIYVNPTQFGPNEDLEAYPRDLDRDLELCRARGVDAVFIPNDAEIYGSRNGRPASTTYVRETQISQRLEGASRPDHFQGVATVVTILLNITQPDLAVFGEKDFQQLALIRRMTRDLRIPVEILAGPTAREPDGLALSSRNRYLTPEQRAEAPWLHQALTAARALVRGRKSGVGVDELVELIETTFATLRHGRLDYFDCFDTATFDPLSRARPGDRAAIAAYFGTTRLIDNIEL